MSENLCVFCKGKLKPGTTDITLRRERSVVVIQAVPALICENCEEASLDTKTAQVVHQLAEREINRGVALEFCNYSAA